jgi:hypothetical protein
MKNRFIVKDYFDKLKGLFDKFEELGTNTVIYNGIDRMDLHC